MNSETTGEHVLRVQCVQTATWMLLVVVVAEEYQDEQSMDRDETELGSSNANWVR